MVLLQLNVILAQDLVSSTPIILILLCLEEGSREQYINNHNLRLTVLVYLTVTGNL